MSEPLNELPPVVYLEPPHGHRKARVECAVPGCTAAVIESHLTCGDCIKLAPQKLRQENRELARRRKAATSNDEAWMLDQALERNCVEIVNAVIERRS